MEAGINPFKGGKDKMVKKIGSIRKKRERECGKMTSKNM